MPSSLFSRIIFFLDLYVQIVVSSNFVRSEYMRSINVELVKLSYGNSREVPRKNLKESMFSVTKFKILNRSGTIVDQICDKVSHILVPKDISFDRLQALNQILNYSFSTYSKRPYLITQDWIDESIRLNALQDELAYNPNKST
jgi:hypothetical protein